MERRDFLRVLAGATVGASLPGLARAAAAPSPAASPFTIPAPGPPTFWLDAYSKNLQWCRTPPELAKAVVELGLKSVDLNVEAFPGHVDPAKAKTDLPAFVSGLKANGIATRAVTLPIQGADSPMAEALLDAAASAGVGYYTWSGVTLNERATYQAQVDALKARFAALAKLNEKHKIKGLYQPRASMAGATFVDVLPALQGLDPSFTGIRYDTAALLQARPENLARHLRMGGRYIGGVALNDAVVKLELPEWKQGRFTGDPEILTRPNGNGDNTGNAGGDMMAYGGGGRPLPYRYAAVPVGTGMNDLMMIGDILKEIGFDGPAETQVEYDLGGVENGADKLTLARQEVLGRLKRDRLTVEHAFREPWGLRVALPAYMLRQAAGQTGAAAARPRGGGGADE